MFISNVTHQKIIYYFKQLWFSATMKITIHEKKSSHFTFHWKKLGHSQIVKISFTSLYGIDFYSLRIFTLLSCIKLKMYLTCFDIFVDIAVVASNYFSFLIKDDVTDSSSMDPEVSLRCLGFLRV